MCSPLVTSDVDHLVIFYYRMYFFLCHLTIPYLIFAHFFLLGRSTVFFFEIVIWLNNFRMLMK